LFDVLTVSGRCGTSNMSIDADPEQWALPIVGFEVLQVWFSGETYLIVYGTKTDAAVTEAPHAQLSFGGAFRLLEPNGTLHFLDGGGPWEALVQVLSLRHAVIESATADRQGHLVVRFEPGFVITAEPDPQYEAWGMSGPGSLILACPPGGGDPRIST
jgi:Family of unknown function (DUF6188)